MPDIPILKSHDIEQFNQAIAGFVSACNHHVTEYDVRGSTSRQKSIIKRVVATKPKLILAIGATAAQVAKDMVEDIPVVFFMVLLRSLRHVRYALYFPNTTLLDSE